MQKVIVLILLMFIFQCSQKEEQPIIINTFTVGHLELVDTLGSTRPINTKDGIATRDETIDLIYKIDSALKNELDSIALYNGHFIISRREEVNDSLLHIAITTKTKTDWRKKRAKINTHQFELFALYNHIVRFDYLDNYTVYRLTQRQHCKEDTCQLTSFDALHTFIDSMTIN